MDAGRIFPIAPTSRIHGEFMLRNMNSKGHSGRVFCERVRVARAFMPAKVIQRIDRDILSKYEAKFVFPARRSEAYDLARV